MPTWTSVTTTNAPAWYILGHARHLLDQGAFKPIYFLDMPEIYSSSDFEELQRNVRIVLCNDDYWNKLTTKPGSVPKRQLINLKVARAFCACDWFLHLDSDEFLHLERDFADLTHGLPTEIHEIRLQNFERIISPDAPTWHTGRFRVPCWDTAALSQYPEFIQPFLGLGLANYYHGKSFVKNRPNLLQGIHGAIRKSEFEVIRFHLPWEAGFVGHYQFNGYEAFYKRITNKRQFGGALLEHEKAQARWIADANFGRDDIFRIAKSLFEAQDTEAERYMEHALFREMPQAYTERLANAFDAEQLRFP